MNKRLRFIAIGALLFLLGVGTLTAQEVVFSAGPAVPFLLQGSNGGFAFGDVNGDGTLDVFIPPNNITLNYITSFASAVSTRTAALTATVNSVGGLFADFNGDGVLDLWSTNDGNPRGGLVYDSAGVYRLASGTGALASAGASSNVFCGMAVADIDHSNYLSATWSNVTPVTAGDAVVYPRNLGIELLKGGASGFTRVGKGATAGTLAIDTSRTFESWQVHFLDGTNDSYPDLLMPSFRHGFSNVDNQVDSIGARKGCIFYLNDGTGKFIVPNAASVGRTLYNVDSISQGKSWGRVLADTGIVVEDTVRHFAAIGSTWGDLNNDGNFDVLLVGLGATDNYNGNGASVQMVLLYGKGDGTFTYKWNGTNYVDAGLPQGSGVRAWDVGDYNNDGIPDLFGSPNFAAGRMFRGNGNGTFTEVSSAVYMAGPGGRAGGFVDYNNDGFLDTYTYTGGNSYLQKNGGNSNHWIAFTPVGTGNNKSAIGARFTLYTQGGASKQTRIVKGEGNANGGQTGTLRSNFGIGLSTSVDSVVVRWPDGTSKTYTGLAVDKYWTIKQGSDVPTAPSLTSPADAATSVAVADTLKWNAGTNAVSYSVQVSMDPTFANKAMMAVNSTAAGTSYAYSLGAATKYYWRVAAINGGFTSSYTSAKNFTTAGVAAATVPAKISPINNAANQAGSLALKVGKTANASRYHWQVSSLPAFTPFFSDSTSDTTLALQLNAGIRYYWRVRASNDLGASVFSAIDTFTVRAAPSAPALSAPASGSLNVIVDSVIFKWVTTGNVDAYVMELSWASGPTLNVNTYTVNAPDTLYMVRNLSRNTTYYWRVRSTNTGGSSIFGGTSNFTTVPAIPPVPAPNLPASAAVSVNRLTTFTWNASTNASKYRLQVGADNAFASVVRDTTVFEATALTLNSPLTASTDYYWRIRSENVGGASNYSTARLFTTGTVLSVGNILEIPKEFALFQNYPNPFNPSTTVRYDIPKSAYVKVVIFDVLGRAVANLVDGIQDASTYSVQWNPAGLGSGVYFLRIQARSTDGSGDFTSTKKLIFMK